MYCLLIKTLYAESALQMYELFIILFSQAFAGGDISQENAHSITSRVESEKNETNFRSCVYDK